MGNQQTKEKEKRKGGSTSSEDLKTIQSFYHQYQHKRIGGCDSKKEEKKTGGASSNINQNQPKIIHHLF